MPEPITTTVILSVVAEAFIGALAGNVTNELMSKLKGASAQNAFKQGLGVAIHRYGTTGSRLNLTRPLLQQNGPLTEPNVAFELAKIVQFDQEPNIELIGQRWKVAMTDPPQWRDFTSEAKLFLEHLRAELRATEVFGPVFDAEALDSIAADAAISAESLANIEAQMAAMIDMLDARLGGLVHAFSQASFSVRDQILDFTRYIEEKPRGFVGRQWVFDEVGRFMDENPRGYFFIIGDPGIGKSTLAAQIVKQNGYLHHFNIRSEGINKATTFLKNVCAQLIAAYELKHTVLPPETTDDAGFLNKLLGEVSKKLKGDDRCVIVVDALDEVDRTGTPTGANLLYLPLTVPERIYFVVTMREDDERKVKPRIDCEQDELYIEHDSSDNLADITDFVQASLSRLGIRTYITAQNIESSEFATLIVQKSEGNFMYLRYVLPEIERGVYKDLELADIPIGLQSYYQDHWQRMRGLDEEAWFEYKLPVIVTLTVVLEPVSIDLISNFSKVQRKARIRSVLRDWAPFLHDEQVNYEGNLQRRYRLYHASFFDFITQKEDVADERVDLKAAHGQIADTLWDDLFGDE
ncbi:ATP-binding protein [Chloroflexi bacterium TSY]|nr:ATP-binding protein [Chloroflexi bacterium TSY]